MIGNYFKMKLEWAKQLYGARREVVNSFLIFFTVAGCAFLLGQLSSVEFSRAKIEIEACSLLAGEEASSAGELAPARASAVASFAGSKAGSEETSKKEADASLPTAEIFIREAKKIEPVKEKKVEVSWCDFNAGINASIKSVIFNEVAWMGSEGDSADEWIEFKNTAPIDISLAGWQVQDRAGQIRVDLSGLSLRPSETLVLSRREDRLALWARRAYSGTLSNSNEEVRLFSPDCEVVDSAKASSSWPAGDNKEKRTMERSDDLSWHTYNGGGQIDAGVLVMGTPGRENSLPPSEPESEFVAPPIVTTATPKARPADEVGEESVLDEPVLAKKLLINCLAITGGPSKTKEDMIEIYNPGSDAVNLKGYRLVKRTKTGTSDSSIKSWTGDELIEPGGFYMWANSSFESAGANVSTSATISNNNGVAIRFGGADSGEVIDSVAWGEAENDFIEGDVFGQNPEEAQKLCRQNFQDTDNNLIDFKILDY